MTIRVDARQPFFPFGRECPAAPVARHRTALRRADLSRPDVVNLGYVPNVIEDPAERPAVLRAAFAQTASVLVVSALRAPSESR